MRLENRKLPKLRQKDSARGFSLIELLIVVAVILIIAGIAIPNFIRSKERANEAAAVSNLRTISTAEVSYSTSYGIGFSPTLASLGGNPTIPDPTQAGLIDSVLSTGVKTGYVYTFVVTNTDPGSGDVLAYTINADPSIVGTSGDLHYFTDQTDIIRVNTTQIASVTDSPIQ